uniref:Integrase n=1 Tax=Candidatus Nitrotoga fabula TaxID=2182327 RepID=A0A2X0QUE8_9PROT|nr:Integrase [Candidatus Nitrotoga fabula]
MAKSLTVKEIESLKPETKGYRKCVDQNLNIWVAPNGKKTWSVRYTVNGKQCFGTLPKPFGNKGSGYMTLAEARTECQRIQGLARSGIDYRIQHEEELKRKAELKEKEARENSIITNLFDSWIENGVNRKDGNKSIVQSFKKHVLPTIGNIKIKELNEHHLTNLYRSIINSGKNRTAVLVSKDICQMLAWGEKRRPWRSLMAEGNPASLVQINKLLPPDYTNIRERILSSEEIWSLNQIFLTMTANYNNSKEKNGIERPLKKETQHALWISLSTTCRIGELLKSEWCHVDFTNRTWFIPKENTKGEIGNKQSITVFLSDFTLKQFKELYELTKGSKWVFPATYKSMSHICEKAISKQVGDRQIKFKNRTKKLTSRRESNSLVLGNEDWTPHDLRRTGATLMQKLGITNHIVDLCQNHSVLTGTQKHYLLHEYDDEKKDAWQRLGQELERIINLPNPLIR